MNKEQRKLVSMQVKYAYDRHVQELLAHLETVLKMIDPNKNVNLDEMLRAYNKLVGGSIEAFQVESCKALDSVLTKMIDSKLSESSRDEILRDLERFSDPHLYEKRFSIMVEAILRHARRFGITYTPDETALNLNATLSQCHAVNSMCNIKSQYTNIIEMRVHSGIQQADEVVILQPNIMGFGIDLKALFKKVKKN